MLAGGELPAQGAAGEARARRPLEQRAPGGERELEQERARARRGRGALLDPHDQAEPLADPGRGRGRAARARQGAGQGEPLARGRLVAHPGRDPRRDLERHLAGPRAQAAPRGDLGPVVARHPAPARQALAAPRLEQPPPLELQLDPRRGLLAARGREGQGGPQAGRRRARVGPARADAPGEERGPQPVAQVGPDAAARQVLEQERGPARREQPCGLRGQREQGGAQVGRQRLARRGEPRVCAEGRAQAAGVGVVAWRRGEQQPRRDVVARAPQRRERADHVGRGRAPAARCVARRRGQRDRLLDLARLGRSRRAGRREAPLSEQPRRLAAQGQAGQPGAQPRRALEVRERGQGHRDRGRVDRDLQGRAPWQRLARQVERQPRPGVGRRAGGPGAHHPRGARRQRQRRPALHGARGVALEGHAHLQLALARRDQPVVGHQREHDPERRRALEPQRARARVALQDRARADYARSVHGDPARAPRDREDVLGRERGCGAHDQHRLAAVARARVGGRHEARGEGRDDHERAPGRPAPPLRVDRLDPQPVGPRRVGQGHLELAHPRPVGPGARACRLGDRRGERLQTARPLGRGRRPGGRLVDRLARDRAPAHQRRGRRRGHAAAIQRRGAGGRIERGEQARRAPARRALLGRAARLDPHAHDRASRASRRRVRNDLQRLARLGPLDRRVLPAARPVDGDRVAPSRRRQALGVPARAVHERLHPRVDEPLGLAREERPARGLTRAQQPAQPARLLDQRQLEALHGGQGRRRLGRAVSLGPPGRGHGEPLASGGGAHLPAMRAGRPARVARASAAELVGAQGPRLALAARAVLHDHEVPARGRLARGAGRHDRGAHHLARTGQLGRDHQPDPLLLGRARELAPGVGHERSVLHPCLQPQHVGSLLRGEHLAPGARAGRVEARLARRERRARTAHPRRVARQRPRLRRVPGELGGRRAQAPAHGGPSQRRPRDQATGERHARRPLGPRQPRLEHDLGRGARVDLQPVPLLADRQRPRARRREPGERERGGGEPAAVGLERAARPGQAARPEELEPARDIAFERAGSDRAAGHRARELGRERGRPGRRGLRRGEQLDQRQLAPLQPGAGEGGLAAVAQQPGARSARGPRPAEHAERPTARVEGGQLDVRERRAAAAVDQEQRALAHPAPHGGGRARHDERDGQGHAARGHGEQVEPGRERARRDHLERAALGRERGRSPRLRARQRRRRRGAQVPEQAALGLLLDRPPPARGVDRIQAQLERPRGRAAQREPGRLARRERDLRDLQPRADQREQVARHRGPARQERAQRADRLVASSGAGQRARPRALERLARGAFEVGAPQQGLALAERALGVAARLLQQTLRGGGGPLGLGRLGPGEGRSGPQSEQREGSGRAAGQGGRRLRRAGLKATTAGASAGPRTSPCSLSSARRSGCSPAVAWPRRRRAPRGPPRWRRPGGSPRPRTPAARPARRPRGSWRT